MAKEVELDWLSPEELRVWRAFNRAHQAISARLDEDAAREIGLPRTYLDILFRLHRAPGHALRMTRLAEITHSKASRITHAVGQLEQEGLVRREVPEGDRRGWLAVLTEEGERRLAEAAPRYASSIREHYLQVLSERMREQITTIGETLLARLDPELLPGAGEKEDERD
ncbi:MarR family winged helix-turn-helix transcriptional regulator [Sciscionella sediminilitoris]|uniref:MarR family winged helix-turn-helix transcriptional regulator n=1 Tax=Sciscionella sediminilitoris TaxID=1445613 RepID=UPI00068944E0|nr:MarR family transcriptional regulator [Sciscionella sp. SE31]